MDIIFSLKEVALVVLFGLGAGVGVYLIISLFQISKLVKNLNGILAVNAEGINATVTLMPSIAFNVNEAVVGVKDSLSTVDHAVDSLDHSLLGTVGAVGAGADSVMTLINLVTVIVQNIARGFSAKKRR